MGTTARQRSIRLEKWIHDEIDELAKAKEIDFTEMINFLLEDELNHLGYTKANYNAKKFDLTRNENNENTQKTGAVG